MGGLHLNIFFPCMLLLNLPDNGQKWLKHVVDDNSKYSLLKVVFTLTIQTFMNKIFSFFSLTFIPVCKFEVLRSITNCQNLLINVSGSNNSDIPL